MFKALSSIQKQSFVINLSAFCATLLLMAFILLISYVFVKGSSFFWPQPVYEITYQETNGTSQNAYAQFLSGYKPKYSGWLSVSTASTPHQGQIILDDEEITSVKKALDVAEISLLDGRRIIAKIGFLSTPTNRNVDTREVQKHLATVKNINYQILTLTQGELALLDEQIAQFERTGVSTQDPEYEKALVSFHSLVNRIDTLSEERKGYVIYVTLFNENTFKQSMAEVKSIRFPSNMSLWQRIGVAFSSLGSFLSESPQQANTAGGIFPALFGTIVMVLLMTLIVAPFGVLAAIYMHEYAPNNMLITTMRVCISNMAAVPSIVYGVFGLGFLVYKVGGNIDNLFFSDSLPSPTMGAPGIFWAAVTMALLTLPVVIVATDEGLNRVPQGLRRGSYALGATKSETVWYTVLPFASPSIITGIILAIARAAGEVAPLMLLGAVRFAPNLPLDSEFPFLHLDRQFMHLGVLIYDGAFSSQTSAQGASMMFAACSLLLLVVLILNIVAVTIRARLRDRYQ